MQLFFTVFNVAVLLVVVVNLVNWNNLKRTTLIKLCGNFNCVCIYVFGCSIYQLLELIFEKGSLTCCEDQLIWTEEIPSIFFWDGASQERVLQQSRGSIKTTSKKSSAPTTRSRDFPLIQLGLILARGRKNVIFHK